MSRRSLRGVLAEAGWLAAMISILACGAGDGSEDAVVEETPAGDVVATESAGDRAEGGERARATIPSDPKETTIALIEAFRNGDRERAGELYPRRRWGDEAGFERMAEGYRGGEFDLRPESIEVYERDGVTQVAVNGTAEDGAEMVYVFLLYEDDGSYRVDEVEGRYAGVP